MLLNSHFFCCYLNLYTMFLAILSTYIMHAVSIHEALSDNSYRPIIDHLCYDSSGQFGMTIIQSNFSFCSVLVSVQPALLYTIEWDYTSRTYIGMKELCDP